MTRSRRLFGRRRGSILAFAAVFLPATLGVMALGIDLGMLFHSRIQAQRAADAAALAGASAYLETTFSSTVAEDRAREFAALNDIRGTLIDPDAEVFVEVRPAQFEVYVHVQRDSIPTWFARFLGITSNRVSADATAQAAEAGTVNCLRPLAIPDYWHDPDNDANGNRAWDYDEDWEYTNGTDNYTQPVTGFGTDYRDATAPPYVADRGRRVILKQPQGNAGQVPGWFYPLRLDGNSGADDYADSFTECEEHPYSIGDTIPPENGAMVGKTIDGVLDAIATDPAAQYDPGTGTIINSAEADWRDSGRMLLLAIFDPRQLPGMGGSTPIIPNNFGYFFIEGFMRQDGTICQTDKCADQGNYKGPVVGRFMYYAEGFGGDTTGSLVRQLRLVD